ncbi:MAG: response regulator transcription factor [Spirochaetaceae bacterium]
MRLLLVDDSPEIRKQLPRLLDGVSGVEEVALASDADSGLYRARQLHPDLMIIDLELRHSSMNGIELISRLAELERRPSLVVYTNHHELRRYALRAGADLFFSKGSETGTLIETLRRLAATEGLSR